MCGRYALYGPQSRLREQFGVDLAELRERFNIAPTQEAPVVRAGADGGPELIDARWGLLPSWVKEPGKLAQPINAKIETAGEKPMFRHAFKRSRVLVPASGFYEWVPLAGTSSRTSSGPLVVIRFLASADCWSTGMAPRGRSSRSPS